jgi:hypothetical protein
VRVIQLRRQGRAVEVVAGLVWHPLDGTRAAGDRQVRRLAESGGYDLKLLRGEARAEARHVGLASRLDGIAIRQVSAAAVVADALVAEGHRNLLVALPLPDQPNEVLFVSTQGGVILADGDTSGPAAEIQARLRADLAYGGWDLVVCPQAWDIAGAQARDFHSFFGEDALQDTRRWRLQRLRPDYRALALLGAGAGVLVAAAGYGVQHWRQAEARDLAPVAAQQALAQEAAARGKASPVEARTAEPWRAQARPPAFARACLEALARTGTTAGNWKLDGAACEQGQLSVRWTKAGDTAWVSHLQALRPSAVVAADGLSATVSTPLAAQAPQDAPEPLQALQSLEAARLRYFDLAPRFGMVIRAQPPVAAGAAPALPGQAPLPPPAPAWAEAPLQVAVGFDPAQAAALLDAPGLRFHRLVVTWSRDGLPLYQFTGVHYVRP